VRHYGPAYAYPQNGWIVLHVEGAPYARGYQHGRLLGKEVEAYVRVLGRARDPKSPSDGWRELRSRTNALFLRRFDREYLEEMKGIADGAAAAGAKQDERPLDLLDVAAINVDIEAGCLEGALEATATGLEGRAFHERAEGKPEASRVGHCSAFVATGPATADGHVVIGHITMDKLYRSRHENIWLDIKPVEGLRVVMQSYPGGIQSGTDYYQNDAGMAVVETTLNQTAFNLEGTPLASRIRKALQYGDSIDDVVSILAERNNGLYTNEWLIADARTDEIAMFELGTHQTRLWRSSKGEWFGGTEGFYWGCNNAKDMKVRLDTVPGAEGKPANLVFRPSDRDLAWMKLFDSAKGRIDTAFGVRAFTSTPLAAWPSLDAKVASVDMIKNLKTVALFGPPMGRTREPNVADQTLYPDIGPLVPNDWTLLTTEPPPVPEPYRAPAVDLDGVGDDQEEAHESLSPPAWHGTLLPGSGGDIWLCGAFADLEKIVALERALKANHGDGVLTHADRERLARAMAAPRSRYLSARARLGRELPLNAIEPDLRSNEWADVATGKGVLALAELRRVMGTEKFDAMMDVFGRAHAGKLASTAEFFTAAEAAHGMPLADLKATWLGTDAPTRLDTETAARWRSGRFWAVTSFEQAPDQALIIYGTLKETDAQREAAERLQQAIRRRCNNITLRIVADNAATESDRTGRHLLLIGRPDTNAVTGQLALALPVRFGTGSFTIDGKTYAHPASAVIAAGPNRKDPAHAVIVFAGLSASATWKVVESLPLSEFAEVILVCAGGPARPRVVSLKDERRDPAGAD